MAILDELRVLLDWFVLESPIEYIYFAIADPPHELHLIWSTVSRVCHIALAEADVQRIFYPDLTFSDHLREYGRPVETRQLTRVRGGRPFRLTILDEESAAADAKVCEASRFEALPRVSL